MWYSFWSLLMFLFLPELGEGFADAMRSAFESNWHGGWYWIIGLLLVGLRD